MMDTLEQFAVQIALIKPEYDVKKKHRDKPTRVMAVIVPVARLQCSAETARFRIKDSRYIHGVNSCGKLPSSPSWTVSASYTDAEV